MKTPLPQFLTAPYLSVVAAVAVTVAILLGAALFLPRYAPVEVRANSVSGLSTSTAGDFEPQSRHYSAALNGKKPAAGKLKKARIQSPPAAAAFAGN